VAEIELRSVGRSYGAGRDERVKAVADVTLTITAGSLVALTGASGSGKSTLLVPNQRALTQEFHGVQQRDAQQRGAVPGPGPRSVP
jgi:ABC-type lipoprotein export system ATPase subunit